MNSRKMFQLIFSLVLILSMTLPAWATTRAQDQQPLQPQQPWKGPTDAPQMGADDPNSPENLAKIEASDAPVRVIIQLTGTPVAQYRGGLAGLAPVGHTPNGKLDMTARATQAYRQSLLDAQARFERALVQVASAATVQYRYQLAYNGIAAQVPGSSIPALRKMAGVRS